MKYYHQFICFMHLLLKILACVLLLFSCQTQPAIKTADYTVKEGLNLASARLLSFREDHNLNMMANLQWSGMVDDSLIFVAMAVTKDTLYALNCHSGYLRVMPLTHLRKNQIIMSQTFFYHNHDSIFFCIKREGLVKTNRQFNRNDKDILLVSGKGELLNTYSLDSLPDIYSGERSDARHYPWDEALEERFFANGLLVDAVTKYPTVTKKGFAAINPKIMALLDLKDGAIRMLNIRYPVELQEKEYCWPPELWVKVTRPKEMLVGFTVTPFIYRYDLERDTMVKLDVRYDGTFYNTDSASMIKGKDYPMVLFRKPVWSPENSCYLREVYFYRYPGHTSSGIVELLDSVYNHIGYVYADKKRGWQEIQCHADGSITVADQGGYGRHTVQLTGKMRNTCLSVLERRSMDKKPKTAGNRSLKMNDYIKKMNLPDSCSFALINMKYPCGSCIQDLVSFYKENQKLMEKERIYYLFYDPEHRNDNAILEIFGNCGVQNPANIRIDHTLLHYVTNVLPNGLQLENTQYVVFIRKDNQLGFAIPTFTELMFELQRNIKRRNNILIN